jgi:hypothetical protein
MEMTGLSGFYPAMRDAVSFSPIAMEHAVDAGSTNRASTEQDTPPADERQDTFTLSERGRAAAMPEEPGAVQNENVPVGQQETQADADRENASQENLAKDDSTREEPPKDDAEDQPERPNELSEEDQQVVQQLRQEDQRVRAHEQAHAAAGATNVRYEYQTGPDGRQYAVAGTADISIQAQADDPDSKLVQAQKMRAAALAPADPSTQDMAVAAKASRVEMQARMEKANAELEAMVNESAASESGSLAYGLL